MFLWHSAKNAYMLTHNTHLILFSRRRECSETAGAPSTTGLPPAQRRGRADSALLIDVSCAVVGSHQHTFGTKVLREPGTLSAARGGWCAVPLKAAMCLLSLSLSRFLPTPGVGVLIFQLIANPVPGQEQNQQGTVKQSPSLDLAWTRKLSILKEDWTVEAPHLCTCWRCKGVREQPNGSLYS